MLPGYPAGVAATSPPYPTPRGAIPWGHPARNWGGDLWELYRGLDGGSKIAITNGQEVPRSGQARFSDEFKGQPGSLRTGPVYPEFHVVHPFDTVRDDRADLCRSAADRKDLSEFLDHWVGHPLS